MPERSSDDFDNDSTDELPILLESDVLGEEPTFAAARAEDTSEHTAMFHAAEQPSAGVSALHAELAQHAAQTAELEEQLTSLTLRVRELDQRVAEKDRLIGELKRTVTALRDSANDLNEAERRVAAQLAARDERLADAAATIERLQREAAARSEELNRLRAAAETAQREAAAATELAARVPEPSDERQKLLEDNAGLRDYIAGRQAWWNELEARNAGLVTKVADLQSEVAAAKKALAAAQAFAARESDRAVALRAELVDYARRASELERELRAARTRDIDAQPARSLSAAEPARGEAPPAPERGDELAPGGPPAEIRPAAAAAPTTAAPEQDLPLAAEAIGSGPPAVEAIAELEAEVGHKRQQVAAQLVELRERDQRLQAATGDLERMRRELSTLRNELDESRSTVARLERAVIDKDRALQARDARIATLHEELKQRLGAIEKLNAIDFSMTRVESPAAPRPPENAVDNASAPELLCLTGEAPKRFALTKKTITVGRGPQCDLQILTHFVSREHARVTVNGGSVVIEDLGSRNGVYVNAVRVDRHALQQGDLVTIGETQFRFMESKAH